MRLVVHDYSGHPGQVTLSRALARRGHDVVHQWCPAYTSGHGDTARRAGDPAGLSFEPVDLTAPFARYSPVRRLRQELEYGARAARRLLRARPDAVVLSNVPLLALAVVVLALRARRVPYVFWQQDVYSAAVAEAARRRLGPLGGAVARLADALERAVARRAAGVVPISTGFLPVLDGWGVPRGRVRVVPNWMDLAEVPLRPRDNDWAREHDLVGRPVLLYAGTLGLKHDPALLADLARAVPPHARVVVVSQGRGRDELEGARAVEGLDRLVLLDFQPYDVLPDVLATADVLVALLEAGAGRWSVPSKVLTYLCAGRPVLAALPPGNDVAELLRTSGAGVVVAPGDRDGAVRAALGLLDDPAGRARRGDAGRACAERTFDPDRVAGVFEELLRAVA